MIKQLETHYLEQQLRKAEQEQQSQRRELALMHYQRAYNEACWLCDHFIEGECAGYAEQAIHYLQYAAAGCIACSDSTQICATIEADRNSYQLKINTTFGVEFSQNLLK